MQEVIDTVPYGRWGQIKKAHQVLPAEVSAVFKNELKNSLRPGSHMYLGGNRMRSAYAWKLVDLGWTLSAVADSMELTRERVRQLTLAKPKDSWLDYVLTHYPLPLPPVYAKRSTGRYERNTPQPSEQTKRRLLELLPMAEAVRGHSPKNRAEADEFVRLLNYSVRVEKVRISTLARLLGVTNAAVSHRMVRYGYKKTTGKSGALKKVLKKNRVKGRK